MFEVGRKQLDKKNTGNACMVVVISESVSKRDELSSEEYFNRPQQLLLQYITSFIPRRSPHARKLNKQGVVSDLH